MDGKSAAGWVAAGIAIIGAVGGWYLKGYSMMYAVGQEAGEQAAVEYMEPMQKELVDIRFAQEREFIDGKWEQCMTYRHKEASDAEREILCDDEKDWRWETYYWTACVEEDAAADSTGEWTLESALPECGMEPELEGGP